MKKKIQYILLSSIFFFLFLCSTNAKEVLRLDWETEEYTTEMLTDIYDYNIRNIEYKNGYVTTRIEENEQGNLTSYLTYYDTEGKIITKKDMGAIVFLDIIVYKDNIYALVATSQINLIKLDSSFSIVKRIAFDESTSSALMSMLHSEIPFFGIHLLAVQEEGIKIITIDFDTINVEVDFSDYEVEPYNEETLEKYFSELHELENYELTDVYYYNLKKNTTNTVLSGIKPNDCLFSNDDCEYDSVAYMTLQDQNGKELWSKEYPEYKEFINTFFLNNYIITIGIIDEEDLAPCEIVVIDLNGNVVQTIKNNNSYFFMQPTSRGIIVTNYKESENNGNNGINNEEGRYSFDEITTKTEVYQFLYSIEKKTTGNGTIEVMENSVAGKPITFVITPEKGYVLGVVKVTDANGNVLTFTSNTFTMPSSDVTIEVTFVPENPDTKDITIVVVLITAIIGGIFLIQNKKKLHWLN